MKIPTPKALGKRRYVQCTDIVGELRRQRAAVWPHLVVYVFGAAIAGLLAFGWLAQDHSWGRGLLAAFMALGAAVGLHDCLRGLTLVPVGIVCDRGVGYCWFRRDGSVARQQWYAFGPETHLREWQGRNGRVWNMQNQHGLAFCEGRKKRFVASYLVGYEDETHLEFMRRASDAFLAWRWRYRRAPKEDV